MGDFPSVNRLAGHSAPEVFNLTNAGQFGQPNNNFGSSSAGKVTSLLATRASCSSRFAWPFELALKQDRKSTRLNSSHSQISYAVFCLKKKNNDVDRTAPQNKLAIHSAEHIGIHIPRFCDHPLLAPVAHCRPSVNELVIAANMRR